MIQTNNSIRLTAVEVQRLSKITGFEPKGIKTIADFQAYIDDCKMRLAGDDENTVQLHTQIDDEAMRCIAA